MKAKKNLLLITAGLLLAAANLPAQTNLSIPLTDESYQLLEYASLKGYLPLLSPAKPYSQHYVISRIDEVLSSENLSDTERNLFEQTKERLNPTKPEPWYLTGNYTNRFNENIQFPVTAGISWKSALAVNANVPQLSSDNWANFYFLGDITDYISYRIDGSGALQRISLSAYAPYTFDKSWDGWQSALGDWYGYSSVVSDHVAGALKLEPELVASAFNDKVTVRFSRTRHDYGYGSSSIIISEDAQPFLALETHLNPVKWFETNFITGALEYENTESLKDPSTEFQNMYSLITGQFNIADRAYFGAYSSAVWMKRLELGYMHPFLLPFTYQNQAGDFDNIQMGLYGGVRIPNITHLYASLFVDEWNLSTPNFFNKDRNMYAFQAGAKTPVPVWLSSLTTQYTKIEPYMYTHPLTTNPWYSQSMDTAYVNHGECIGYYLPPNSDEFLIKFESNPLWYLRTMVSYSLVRHGMTTGSKAVDGSSLSDYLDYSGSTASLEGIQEGALYWKDFLHDGAYEWINYATLGATVNCKKWNLPLYVTFAYTFCYTGHSYGTSSSLEFINDEEYSDTVGNYFSISVKIY